MIVSRPLALLAALPLLAPLAGDGTKLAWHFSKGDVLRYRTTYESSTEISMLPDQTFETVAVSGLREEVKDVAADGSATVEVNYEAIRIDADLPPSTKMSFDSTLTGDAAKGNDPELSKAAAIALAAKFTTKIDANGHVGDIAGGKETFSKISEGLGMDPRSQVIQRMLSEDSLRKALEENVYPDKALADGETWHRDIEMSGGGAGTIKMAIDNKLIGKEDHAGASCAKIEMTTKVSIESADNAQFQMTMDADRSRGKGTLWFDLVKGRMVDYAMTTDMEMAFQTGGNDMTFSISTTIKMQLLGKDEPAVPAKPAAEKK